MPPMLDLLAIYMFFDFSEPGIQVGDFDELVPYMPVVSSDLGFRAGEFDSLVIYMLFKVSDPGFGVGEFEGWSPIEANREEAKAKQTEPTAHVL